MSRAFRKMHGLGNDFVVIDARSVPFHPGREEVVRLCDRRRGIGADQLIILCPPKKPGMDVFMVMANADGSEVRACGNASRCVAALMMKEKARGHVKLETVSGVVEAKAASGNRVTVDMGEAKLGWQQIPLAEECDTLHLPLVLGPLANPVAVNMGNPHCVFFVEDAAAVDLAALGPVIEHHALFPDRVNVEVVQVQAPDKLLMRVWERGSGITEACGSGACAVLVAAVRRGLSARKVTVIQPGGNLEIEWLENTHVLMTGDWAESFTGTWMGC